MITREEYELLKNYRDIGFNWLARDKNLNLFTYREMPRRSSTIWNVGGAVRIRAERFTFIKWEDDKPTKINDLIRDYESHKEITGGNNLNKTELIKEIEEILDDIGVSDYQLGECDEDTIWTISSITIREIFSAIEKCSIDSVKVTLPQYVANWIKEVKGLKRNFKLEYLFDTTEMPDDVYDWLDERYGDTDILAKAWIDGFEVEKEKLYIVELPNHQRLAKIDDDIKFYDEREWFEKNLNTKLTRAEIEAVDPRLMEFAKEVE